MTDLWQSNGDVAFPTYGDDVADEQLFSVFDPGRDRLLALFKAAICWEFGRSTSSVESDSPWGIARVGTKLASALPVADTLYRMPTRAFLRETKVAYPLLALYRMQATHDEATLHYDRIACTWGFDYILGPLSADDERRLMGALNAVRMLIPVVIRGRGHPAFESGALQFGQGNGRFSSIRVTTSAEGPATFGQDGEGVEFPAIHLELETTELDDADGEHQGAPLEGATFTFGVGGSEDAEPELIIARTEPELMNPPKGSAGV